MYIYIYDAYSAMYMHIIYIHMQTCASACVHVVLLSAICGHTFSNTCDAHRHRHAPIHGRGHDHMATHHGSHGHWLRAPRAPSPDIAY